MVTSGGGFATESQETADVELSGTLGSLVETARSLTQPNAPLIFEGSRYPAVALAFYKNHAKNVSGNGIWIGGRTPSRSAWPRNHRHADPNPAYCSFTVDNKPRLDEAPDSKILAVRTKSNCDRLHIFLKQERVCITGIAKLITMEARMNRLEADNE